MKHFKTMAVLACGMTLGLACGDTARTLLPPDASAQGDAGADGGGEVRPAPRVIEYECELPAEIGPGTVTIGPDQATEAELMAAGYWACGNVSPVPSEEYAETRCKRIDSVTIDAGTATIGCGRRGEDGYWFKPARVVVSLP